MLMKNYSPPMNTDLYEIPVDNLRKKP